MCAHKKRFENDVRQIIKEIYDYLDRKEHHSLISSYFTEKNEQNAMRVINQLGGVLYRSEHSAKEPIEKEALDVLHKAKFYLSGDFGRYIYWNVISPTSHERKKLDDVYKSLYESVLQPLPEPLPHKPDSNDRRTIRETLDPRVVEAFSAKKVPPITKINYDDEKGLRNPAGDIFNIQLSNIRNETSIPVSQECNLIEEVKQEEKKMESYVDKQLMEMKNHNPVSTKKDRFRHFANQQASENPPIPMPPAHDDQETKGFTYHIVKGKKQIKMIDMGELTPNFPEKFPKKQQPISSKKDKFRDYFTKESTNNPIPLYNFTDDDPQQGFTKQFIKGKQFGIVNDMQKIPSFVPPTSERQIDPSENATVISNQSQGTMKATVNPINVELVNLSEIDKVAEEQKALKESIAKRQEETRREHHARLETIRKNSLLEKQARENHEAMRLQKELQEAERVANERANEERIEREAYGPTFLPPEKRVRNMQRARADYVSRNLAAEYEKILREQEEHRRNNRALVEVSKQPSIDIVSDARGLFSSISDTVSKIVRIEDKTESKRAAISDGRVDSHILQTPIGAFHVEPSTGTLYRPVQPTPPAEQTAPPVQPTQPVSSEQPTPPVQPTTPSEQTTPPIKPMEPQQQSTLINKSIIESVNDSDSIMKALEFLLGDNYEYKNNYLNLDKEELSKFNRKRKR